MSEQDRHPKWVKVEPGHVIPAGQPWRQEDRDSSGGFRDWIASEYVSHQPETVKDGGADVFVDSSWRPPLELPTEPTWGIAVHKSNGEMLGRWHAYDVTLFLRTNVPHTTHRSLVLDFIPLTDEQVARIEAAR